MLKLERIYTKPFDIKGKRIFVDRLWARGISKHDAKLDLWDKKIAPPDELREWFKHENDKYPEFKTRYLAELAKNPNTQNFIQTIQKIAKDNDIILLYGAKNTMHNNAVVVAEYLHDKIGIQTSNPENYLLHFYYNDGEANRSKKLPNDIQWLKQHPAVTKQLGVTFSERYDHIIYQNKSLAHDELFKLAQQRLNQ